MVPLLLHVMLVLINERMVYIIHVVANNRAFTLRHLKDIKCFLGYVVVYNLRCT